MEGLLKRCGCGALLNKSNIEDTVECVCGEPWVPKEEMIFQNSEKSLD